jgi:hypothetical protein
MKSFWHPDPLCLSAPDRLSSPKSYQSDFFMPTDKPRTVSVPWAEASTDRIF